MKNHTKIFLFTTLMTQMTSNSLKLLYLIINNASKYIDEINDESKNKLKKYPKYENLIRQTNHDLDDYDEKHIKIKFNSYYDLPLQKNICKHNAIAVTNIIHRFLDHCF